MGPVLAFTFGTNVRDWSLAKKGFLVEVGVERKSVRRDLLWVGIISLFQKKYIQRSDFLFGGIVLLYSKEIHTAV